MLYWQSFLDWHIYNIMIQQLSHNLDLTGSLQLTQERERWFGGQLIPLPYNFMVWWLIAQCTKPQMEEFCYIFISRHLFNVRLGHTKLICWSKLTISWHNCGKRKHLLCGPYGSIILQCCTCQIPSSVLLLWKGWRRVSNRRSSRLKRSYGIVCPLCCICQSKGKTNKVSHPNNVKRRRVEWTIK